MFYKKCNFLYKNTKILLMKNHFSFSNFIKKDNFNINQTYDYTKHTLLNNLYMFGYNQDNIGYILYEPTNKQLIGIDFGEFEISRKIVERLEKDLGSNLTYILTTHAHWDHCNGNTQWKDYRKDTIEIVSGTNKDDPVPAVDKLMSDLETFTAGELCVACMHTPGHTKSAVCWVITQVSENSTKIPFLFCGDTVFIGGCGRVFNGTIEELYDSITKISYLPNDTLVFPGHEYTLKNLEFIKKLDPSNEFVADKEEWAKDLREKGEFTAGSRLVEEKLYNPFFRANDSYYKELTGEKDGLKVFAALRTLKNNF
jgi:hydroxyacylglutathione hydrolase